ncbi:MAG: methyltransferase domain-containing protein [Anaerolineae bacterium]|nr:methyltransferase domain-containing protein [Anaerolineae bacterium]
MLSGKMVERYTDLQAWLHDFFVGQRALNLNRRLFEQSGLNALLAEPKTRRVLDVGCGGGQAALWLKAQYPHLQIQGIDLSEPQIARAQRRAQRQRADVTFEVANAQALPFPDASFDVVCSFGSAKHWPDPLKGIGECWRVLKPGGALLLADSTSDATREHVVSFYRILRFPRLFENLIVPVAQRIIVRPARPMSVYRDIATTLGMPPGSVTQPIYMPAFLFSARKPHV